MGRETMMTGVDAPEQLDKVIAQAFIRWRIGGGGNHKTGRRLRGLRFRAEGVASCATRKMRRSLAFNSHPPESFWNLELVLHAKIR